MQRLRLYVAVLLAQFAPMAQAQSPDASCNKYFDVQMTQGVKELPQAYPSELSEPTEVAVRCLASVISSFDARVRDVAQVETPDVRTSLLSVTAALRQVMDLYDKQGRLNQFIKIASDALDINDVSVLTYAGRGSNRDLRVNAVLILGNGISDGTACVPIVQLGDPRLMQTVDEDTAVRARANLLALTSVTAAWGSQENAVAMQKLQSFFANDVPKTTDFTGTMTTVENLRARLNARPPASRPKLDPAQKAACDAYAKTFYEKFAVPKERQFWAVP
jgi:hypothetical protein